MNLKRFLALLLVFIFGMSSVYGGSGRSPLRDLLFRSERDEHPLPFQFRHQLYRAHILQLLRKTQQQDFSPLLEDDAPSAEEDVRLQLVALLEELAGVLDLEVSGTLGS